MFRLFARRAPTLTAAGLGAAAAAWGLTSWQPAHAKEAATSALSPDEWRAFKLVGKENLTKGVQNPTVLFQFALPDKEHTVGLPVASCLMVRAPIGSEKPDGSRTFVIRPYTPISTDKKGLMELAIKVYPDGKMSQHINHLQPGDRLDFKGPVPKISLEELCKRKRLGLIAGGSGLTPMLQVAEELCRLGKPIEMSMIFANVSEADIIAKDRLDGLAKQHPNFKINYIVDKASSKNWSGSEGYISKDLLARTMPPPSSDSLILVCGPPGLMKAVSGDKLPDKSQGPLSGLLKDMGYSEQHVFKF